MTPDLKNMLQLIQRTKPAEDGWCPVSEACWFLLDKVPVELAEREKLAVGGRVRFTEEGKTVVAWL